MRELCLLYWCASQTTCSCQTHASRLRDRTGGPGRSMNIGQALYGQYVVLSTGPVPFVVLVLRRETIHLHARYRTRTSQRRGFWLPTATSSDAQAAPSSEGYSATSIAHRGGCKTTTNWIG